jgi:RNA polymerase sigma factor (sigma-70 family)
MEGSARGKRFQELVVAHLGAAYSLARSLTHDKRQAEDVVQEACLRAFTFLGGFHGGNERAWLLAIVRNAYYSSLRKNRWQALNVPLDEDTDSSERSSELGIVEDVARALEREETSRLVHAAVDQLPEDFRKVIVLRELEGLSYQEIATLAGIPLGTVMSRLSRARKLLLHTRALRALKMGKG